MCRDREFSAALAVMAAVAGVGFASGREIVIFFAQLGWAAWPGMILASAVFALLVRIVMGFARKTGADELTEVFRRITGGGSGHVIGGLYGLLMAFASAMMLRTCGELGALALPVRNGYLQGMLLALFLAAAVCMGRLRLLPVLGAVSVTAAVLFYGACMLDSRPVRVHMRCETVLNLSGSMWAAVILGLLHACLNGSVAGGTAAVFSGGNFDPAKASAMAGAMMLACLFCGHGAMLRGGQQLYAQSLPSVILAARWGLWGFWVSVGFMFLSSVCTLSATMGALIARMRGPGARRYTAATTLMTAFFMLWVPGSDAAIGYGFPVTGWLCAFFIAAMACVQHEKNSVSGAFAKAPESMRRMAEIDVKF